MRAIVGIIGHIGHGKSSVAGFLEEQGFERASFALALKDACFRVFGPLGAEHRHFHGTQEDKEEPIEALGGRTGRSILQVVGTEGFRAAYPDVWVRTALEVTYAGVGLLAFDDVRFPNEAACIQRAGGKIVRVIAIGKPVPEHAHESESHLEAMRHDLAITAPVGAMDYLRQQSLDLVNLLVPEGS